MGFRKLIWELIVIWECIAIYYVHITHPHAVSRINWMKVHVVLVLLLVPTSIKKWLSTFRTGNRRKIDFLKLELPKSTGVFLLEPLNLTFRKCVWGRSVANTEPSSQPRFWCSGGNFLRLAALILRMWELPSWPRCFHLEHPTANRSSCLSVSYTTP